MDKGNTEVSTLTNSLGQDSAETVEDYSSFATIDYWITKNHPANPTIVNTLINNKNSASKTNGPFGDLSKLHHYKTNED